MYLTTAYHWDIPSRVVIGREGEIKVGFIFTRRKRVERIQETQKENYDKIPGREVLILVV